MIEAPAVSASASPTIKVPRLGFAGVGWIGRHRLAAIASARAGEVAAIFDPAPEAVRAVCTDWPAARCTTDFEDLLAEPLDGIVVATPNALHAGQAIAALESGKAVFCQKPLARTGAEVRAVLAAARRADRLLHVDLSYRWHTGMQRIRELIASGQLGRVYAIECWFHNAYGPDKPWFYDSHQSGGGCLLDLGIHLVDLALWCTDFPSVRSASGHLVSRGQALSREDGGVEDYASALLSLGNGASVQLACSWKAPAGTDAEIGFTVFGTQGGATFRNVGGSFHDFCAEHLLPNRTRLSLHEPPDDWAGRAAINWARALATDAHYEATADTLQAVADTLDRIYGRAP